MPEFDLGRVEVRVPADELELGLYFHLRWQLLREPWDQPVGSERDALEQSAIHVCAVYEGEVIGVGRLQLSPDSIGRIRYMGVSAPFQRKGIGKLMVAYLEQIARQKACTQIDLDARENALRFYECVGYLAGGPRHTLFGVIKHVQMSKILRET